MLFISKYQVLSLFVFPLICSFLLAKPIIILLKKLKSIQAFRDLGPQSHLETKMGTPTMGSWIFVIPILFFGFKYYLSQNAFLNITESSSEQNLSSIMVNRDTLLTLLAFFSAFLMGLFDDSLKVFQSNYKGLSSTYKLIIQFLIVALVLFFSVKTFTIFSLIWAFIVIAGTCNAFNLSDGLDGLATSQAILSLVALQGILCLKGDYSLSPLILISLASLLSFLLFNIKPAKVFMGDSGSLALGMLIGVMAYLKDLEWYLILIAIIPLMESLSVIIQVVYFKITKKILGEGKRLFKMSPLHHHFELSGFSENQIVWGFFSFQFCIILITLFFAHQKMS